MSPVKTLHGLRWPPTLSADGRWLACSSDESGRGVSDAVTGQPDGELASGGGDPDASLVAKCGTGATVSFSHARFSDWAAQALAHRRSIPIEFLGLGKWVTDV